MDEVAALLRALMEAVALRAHSPGGGKSWNETLLRLSVALETAEEAAQASEGLRFHFQDDEVVLGTEPIWELRGWRWVERLSRRGIRSLHLQHPATLSQLESFVVDLEAGLAGELLQLESGLSSRWGPLHITVDALAGPSMARPAPTSEAAWTWPVGTSLGPVPSRPADREPAEAFDTFPTVGELEAAAWILSEVAEGRPLPALEAEALVRILSVGLRAWPRGALSLFLPRAPASYPATHALNTALLGMVLAEERGGNSREVWDLGLAGLLHDVGMAHLPESLLHSEDRPTQDQRERLNTHPVVGARILLEGPADLMLPAVVAYEHHLRVDGGGYPTQARGRAPHPASRLIHVVSVYDALRAPRPYSPEWSHARSLTYIRAGVGGQFDEDIARSFLRLMESWNPTTVRSPARLPGSVDTADGVQEAPR